MKPLRQADVVYCYDGSFAGFLCCVFESFAGRELPFAVWPPAREEPTLCAQRQIETDRSHAERVLSAYTRLLGEDGRALLLRAFLSGEADRDDRLLRFLHTAFAEGPRTLALLGHEDVAPVYAMNRAIGREVEKLMGFLRFEEADGMLGAVIHPKNHVLPLLRDHFCARYPEERFLIYDAAHQEALVYEPHACRYLLLDAPLTLPPPDAKESYYQTLWRRFYDTLAIETRRNEPLRRNLCPRRYWSDMTELRDAPGPAARATD